MGAVVGEAGAAEGKGGSSGGRSIRIQFAKDRLAGIVSGRRGGDIRRHGMAVRQGGAS
jgi:hypothetical protein